ncbi:hypothetical protein [Leifsonia shinshuensis]|uniref:Uncharacterized protein n=1 Tax=Leifsonia shinshuensis TaxID=150026 RepID=A0A7G6Y8N7_9MICO|nr:hypothetical protein [Leifsonia shinshuensis]QNE34852.1 hypothetical protein F1C12_06740 [Leifsonia shinshuensis]
MRWPNWLRKRTEKTVRTRPFDEDALPEPAAPTLEQTVEEGMLLAEYATRMAVKNHIVVDTLQYGNDFDPARHTGEAAHLLRELASEQGEAAGRIDADLEVAQGLRGDATHPHDYRDVDVDNLRLRRDAAVALASALRAKADSEEELLALVERGRVDAWDEVGRAIEAGLDAFSGVEALKADYEREKPGRLKLLIWRDLARLQEEHTGY